MYYNYIFTYGTWIHTLSPDLLAVFGRIAQIEGIVDSKSALVEFEERDFLAVASTSLSRATSKAVGAM
jgi:hypothetical protein